MSIENDETARKIGKFVREMQKDLENQLGQVPDDVYYKVQDGSDPGLDNIVRSVEENTREQLLNMQLKKEKEKS